MSALFAFDQPRLRRKWETVNQVYPQVKILGSEFVKVIFEGTRLQLSRINADNPNSPILIELVEELKNGPRDTPKKTPVCVFAISPEGSTEFRVVTFLYDNSKARDLFSRLSDKGETIVPWPERVSAGSTS